MNCEDGDFFIDVEMMAVPQIGSVCDPDGTGFRDVESIHYEPKRITVYLKPDQADFKDNLIEDGWTQGIILD